VARSCRYLQVALINLRVSCSLSTHTHAALLLGFELARAILETSDSDSGRVGQAIIVRCIDVRKVRNYQCGINVVQTTVS